MSEIRLTEPQFEFVTAPEQFPCFCGGFGAGKTHAAAARAIAKKLQYPKQSVAYYLPTYDLVRTIGFPRFAELLDSIGLPHKINKTDATIDFAGLGQLIFRTMDTPERIIGYEVGDSLVDELDTLPVVKASEAWNKIISRNRQKKPDGSLNTVGVATTPEGFRFVYERWGKRTTPGYRLIKAATQSNAKNLPAGYIDSLKATYSSAALAAYLDGEFVNLHAGSVYPDYDRRKNHSSETIKAGEPLHIGLDFNVTKMAAVVFVMRDGKPHAVREYTQVFDTPAMVALLKVKHPGHQILVYPDASGTSRDSNNASLTDIKILQQAGFTVCAPQKNPLVKNRILAVNTVLRSREFRVNPDNCPELAEALEKQSYDKHGEPDKASGLDHVLDGAGYFIHYKFPVVKPATSLKLGMAH